MNFVRKRSLYGHLFRLNVIIAFFFIFPVFLGGACSKEEPEEIQAPKVVVRINNPVHELSVAAPEKKKEPEEVASQAKILPAPEKKEPAPPAEVEQPEKKMEKEKRDGYYSVQKGDTLFKIAGRKNVYDDPLKWPSLFRINMKSLGTMEIAENFQDKEIPEGLELKFVTSQEAARNLAELGQKFWVVNVFSSQNSQKIVPAALKLMKNGYRIYITTVTIKGKEWMRLRAGFFKDQAEATAAANKIKLVFKEDDAWIAKTGKEERDRFGGY
jgi:hypothetical protein